ncbi:MAG: dTMP kinase, partial [Candidatus Cloacimonetes bacterium]|nr:dTMP kinase [Candidatus Cloacimonadota bacterium]
TQAKLLDDYLTNKGLEVFLTREPGGPKISEKIRNILLDKTNREMLPETEVLLYMASRSQHTGEWIIPLLQAGNIIICDRYYDSTIAYQGAARKIKRNIIDSITKFATFDLVPDVTILIDLPAEIGLARISKESADRLESESIQFHKRVREGFLEIAKSEKQRYIVIDGKKNIQDIHKKIREEIKNILEGYYEI